MADEDLAMRGGYWVGPGSPPLYTSVVRTVQISLAEETREPFSAEDVLVVLLEGLSPYLRAIDVNDVSMLTASHALRRIDWRARTILAELLEESLRDPV